MTAGKVSETVLKRSVLKEIRHKNQNIKQGAAVCSDCAVIDVDENEDVVATSDIITIYSEGMEKTVVYSVLNDLATISAIPVGVMINIMMPLEFEEKSLKKMMVAFNELLAAEDVQIVGGHTEYTEMVKGPVISLDAIGKADKDKLLSKSDIKAGQDIVITKTIGIEGTYRLYLNKSEKLSERFSRSFINKLAGFGEKLSALPEAAVAIKHGVTAMHDLSESGIFGALWEVAAAAGTGIEIQLKDIPIQQETVEVCELFDINPYQMPSCGAMLIICDDGEDMVRELHKESIEAAIIGRTIPGNDKILLNNGEKRFLDSPKSGELVKIFS